MAKDDRYGDENSDYRDKTLVIQYDLRCQTRQNYAKETFGKIT